MGSVSHCHAGMIVLSQLPSTSGFSGAGWLRVFQKIRQLKVKIQLINVNLKHAMFKFYTLTESYCRKSMPRCLTAAFYLFIYFYLPHKRNYCEPTYTVIKKKNQVFMPPMLNSPVKLIGMIWPQTHATVTLKTRVFNQLCCGLNTTFQT